jgi:hypothetical protein
MGQQCSHDNISLWVQSQRMISIVLLVSSFPPPYCWLSSLYEKKISDILFIHQFWSDPKINLVKLDDSWSSYTPSLDWFKWTTNQNVFSKIYFSDCIKMWQKKNFENKKKKSGRGPFFRHGRGRSPIFFFLCGLMVRITHLWEHTCTV